MAQFADGINHRLAAAPDRERANEVWPQRPMASAIYLDDSRPNSTRNSNVVALFNLESAA